jgi:hypothetical protein
MLDSLAAFLIGAGKNSYYGTGSWIIADLSDVQNRWCPNMFERPLGPPLANATKDASGVYHRNFSSGTYVSFDTNANKGQIHWAGGAPTPAPSAPAPAPSAPAPTPTPTPPGPRPAPICGTLLPNTGIKYHDVANATVVPDPASCCDLCDADTSCFMWAWHGEQGGECHLHANNAVIDPLGQRKGCWSAVMKKNHSGLGGSGGGVGAV